MDTPIVSAVIPCYNAGAYLAEAIDSVELQRVPAEVIIVDDGSTDDSLTVARDLQRGRSLPVYVVVQKNQGPAAARNAGLRMARGSYVCFLDADDKYLPRFFSTAVDYMDKNADVVAVQCQIEFIESHRPVEVWQRQAIENSLPSNMVVRTDIARRIGGFPTGAAFRGRCAGEDIAFRRQLQAFGTLSQIEHPQFQYRVRPGGHFDYFLDRGRIDEQGNITFTEKSKEEADGTLAAANRAYDDQVRQRVLKRIQETLATSLESAMRQIQLSQQLHIVPGPLHPFEGFVLYALARHWPIVGRIIALGEDVQQAACWLGAGCADARRTPVAVVGPFKDIAGSSLTEFTQNMQTLNLAGVVQGLGGDVAQVSATWTDPVRLIYLDGLRTAEVMGRDFEQVSRFLQKHGLLVLHGVDVRSEATQLYAQLKAMPNTWNQVGRFHTLVLLERVI